MKRIFLHLHPFLFALASLLFLYSDARLTTSPGQLIRPLVVLWVILGLLYPLAYRVTGDLSWAGVLLTIFVFAFYFTKSDFVNLGLLVITIVAASYLSLRVLKRRFHVGQLSLLLTFASLGAVGLQAISISVMLISIPRTYFETIASRSDPMSLVVPLAGPSGPRPDIYYIILDGYPRADILKEYFGYDNSDFIEYLQGLGFIIPEQSHSNYPRTFLSVSTTLEMRYWDLFQPGANELFFWWMVTPMIDHSRVRASLESIGYTTVSIASDFGVTDNPTADLYFQPYPIILSDYENYVVSATPLQMLHTPLRSFAPIITGDVHRRFILFNFETLMKIPELPGSKFVYSHIISPHLPFVFNADGSPIESEGRVTFGGDEDYVGASKEEYRQRYVGQVRFVNDRLRAVIETILVKSEVPPIILLQADHGSAMLLDFEAPEDSCLRERYSNFAAYYLPGKGPDVIPQDITPVNLFRIIFNEYFGAHLDLLENRQYFIKGYDRFNPMDVTEQVKASCVVGP